MKNRPRLKLKKFYFHPITIFLLLTLLVIVLSGLLNLLQAQATYNTVNVNTNDLDPTLIAVENLLSFDGLKYIISNAAKNFLSFGPLGMFLGVPILAIIKERVLDFINYKNREKIVKFENQILEEFSHESIEKMVNIDNSKESSIEQE